MSSKNEEFITSRKNSSISIGSNKSAISLSNPKTDLMFQKAFLSNFKNIPLNINFNNYNFRKNIQIQNNNNNENTHKSNFPSSSSLYSISNPLKNQSQMQINNLSPSNTLQEKNLMNDIQFNQLVNNINIIFNKIQQFYLQNYPCYDECNSWIELFKIIYDDIIEKNKESEFLDLMKNTLLLMFFSIIIIYIINIQNKNKFCFEEIKNILNIHKLMSESIYGNSLNDPNINAKDESQVLILSCKDMNTRIIKVINQLNKINQTVSNYLLKYFRRIEIESFDNIYNFFNDEIREEKHKQMRFQNLNINQNEYITNNNNISNNNNFELYNYNQNIDNRRAENLIKSINQISLNNQYQSKTSNSNYNNNTNNNNLKNTSKPNKKVQILQGNIATINGVSTFFDSSNNLFLFRKPIKSSTPMKQRFQRYISNQSSPTVPIYNNTQILPTNKTQNNNNVIMTQRGNLYSESPQQINYNYIEKNISNKKIYNGINQNINLNNNYNINENFNQNIIDNNYNYESNIKKTPIKGKNLTLDENLNQLNLLNLKNQILTPTKQNYNTTLIPFPPTKPYTLVLDLDETLVHVPKNGSSILLRPGLRDFLHSLLPYYELIIFTTGVKEYADQIIKFIEKDEKYFSYRLYRQNATFINENYCKDLNKLGRDLKRTIIVDDKPINIKLQKENGIIIKPFIIGDESNGDDFILFDLIRVLIRIAKERPDDVRESLKMYREEIYNKISND